MNIQHPDSTEPPPSLMRPLQWLSNSVSPSIKTAFFKNIHPKAHTCGSQKTCGNCFGSRDWTQVVWLCIKLHTDPSHTFNTAFHKCLHTEPQDPSDTVIELILNYSPGRMVSFKMLPTAPVSTACHSGLPEFRIQVSHVTSVYFSTSSIISFHFTSLSYSPNCYIFFVSSSVV